jgi:WD40 repeat protein/serine/threonine protein kinase
MTTPREETLFSEALAKPAEERASWLDHECAGDTALRTRLEGRLAAVQTANAVAADVRPTIVAEPAGLAEEAVGQTLGYYKLLEKLGEGGCGVVYVAEQTEPVRRRVALKVIKLGMDTRQVVARFEAERQALAMMDHPNIAKVLDAGTTTTGRPYFVMELVRGVKITDYCDQAQLGTRERLDLFIKVCQAIQHAHQKGIIHRDIKPSNILVTMHDGLPVPKVIDFGIAKATEGRLTDNTVYTQLHQFMGTPAYMSPEQAEMSGLDIDTRSDIYSLGVLLYELLTGSTPFDAQVLASQGLDAMRKTIREQEPVRPSTRLSQTLTAGSSRDLKVSTSAGAASVAAVETDPRRLLRIRETISLLKGDLDWIVMKCLEKDRSRRYETANGLVADIQRHLQNEPLLARPPSAVYRLQKSFRRNKLVYVSAGAIASAMLLALIFSGTSYLRERAARVSEWSQRREAETQRQVADHLRRVAEANAAGEREQRARVESLAYATDMNLILQALEQNNLGRGLELLNRNRPRDGEPDRRGWEWRYLWKRSRGDELATLGSHNHAVSTIAFSPSNDELASGSVDGKVKIWNWKNRIRSSELDLGNKVNALAFSPDGRWLAVRSREHGCRVWELATRQEAAEIDVPTPDFSSAVAFSRQGDLIALGAADFTIQIWNFATRTRIASLAGHEAPPRVLIFSRDGKTLYSSGGDDRTVRIWDLNTQREIDPPRWHGSWVSSLALAPDESVLVSSCGDGAVRIWELNPKPESLTEKVRLTNHAALVWDVKFSPDGGMLATCGADQRIRLWDTGTWQEIQVLQGHLSEVWCLAFAPDGKTLASGGKDETVKLWNVLPNPATPPERSLALQAMRLGTILSQDGTSFLIPTGDRLRIGDTRSLRNVREFVPASPQEEDGSTVLLDSGEQRLYVGFITGAIRVLDLNTGNEAGVLTGQAQRILGLALSSDGRRLASIGQDRSILVQDAHTGQHIATLSTTNDTPTTLSFSRDGLWLATGSSSDDILLWDLTAGTLKFRLTGHKGRITSVAFSPDGRMLASGSWDGTAGLWDLATGQRRATLRAHLLGVNSVTFNPDGQRLAAGTGDGLIKLWNVADGQEVLTLQGDRNIYQVTFLPGDETLVSVSVTSLQLWPAPLLRDITEEERHGIPTP